MKIKKFSNKFIQGLLASDDVMDEAVLRGYADSLPYEMSQAQRFIDACVKSYKRLAKTCQYATFMVQCTCVGDFTAF